MVAYYNDSDPFCCQWLRNLMAAGLIPAGHVDERDIREVEPGDLRGFAQCHFFAGIGGWAYALALAGWPADRPVWTGSCPCQPFSSAGRQGGALDQRHLWPRWLRLIEVCKPDLVLGEQVEGAVGFGWVDRVFADLEAQGYACGAAVLGAHSVGAPHIRQRLFWVADAEDFSGRRGRRRNAERGNSGEWTPGSSGIAGWVADADAAGSDRQRRQGLSGDGHAPLRHDADGRGEARGLGNPTGEGCGQGRADSGCGAEGDCPQGAAERTWPGRGAGFWADAAWLPCLDGKARRVEPAIQPLATGVPNRVGLLRGSGNAITPQAAALFIEAVMEVCP